MRPARWPTCVTVISGDTFFMPPVDFNAASSWPTASMGSMEMPSVATVGTVLEFFAKRKIALALSFDNLKSLLATSFNELVYFLPSQQLPLLIGPHEMNGCGKPRLKGDCSKQKDNQVINILGIL